MEIPTELVKAIANGDAVLFVGAGLSQGAKLPGWGELLKPLLDEIKLPEARRADLLQAAQDYQTQRGRRALLDHVVRATGSAGVDPTDNHRRLLRLPIRTWVTTNYDGLLEKTLEQAGREWVKVVRDQDLPYARGDAVTLLKLHGDREQPDTIVLTRRDYSTFFQRFRRVKEKLSALLADKTFFFLGYSIHDPDFAQIHDQIAYDLEEHQRRAYAVLFDVDAFTLADLRQRNIHPLHLETGGQGGHSERLGSLLDELIEQVDQARGTVQQAGVRNPRAGRDLDVSADEMRVYQAAVATPYPPLQRPERAVHFTGREREVAELAEALRPGEVVTLCGPGGIGKSALAAEAIWTLAPGEGPPERFPDGIVMHNFYHQPEAALALEHIARTYGVEPQPAPKEAARRALGGRRALVYLDGTEEAEDLRSVLEVCGGCGVLVTSRRAADARGDLWRVGRLPTQDAVELLEAWAGAWAGERAAAREICELVGGLPLAVRLAGRYLAQCQQPAEGYLGWLRASRLEALDQGERREESVPLLLGRSVAQVSEGAQAALGVAGVLGLSAFDGAAAAAGLGGRVQEAERALRELVGFGLLGRQGERYQVSHALVHTYARERCGVGREAVGRLAAHYAGLAEEESAKGAAGYTRLDEERAHILAVLKACVDRQAWEGTQHLAWVVNRYLNLRGYWTEWVQAIEYELEAARVLGHRDNEARYLSMLGTAHRYQGHFQSAITCYQQTLIVAREIGDRAKEGGALNTLGIASRELGDDAQAIEYYQQALAVAREIGDRRGECLALGNLGYSYYALGDTQEATDHHQQAITLARETGNREMEVNALLRLGLIYNNLRDTRRAIDYYQQALMISKEIGDHWHEASSLGHLGIAYFNLGEYEQAIDYHQQGLAVALDIGDRRLESSALGGLGLDYRGLKEFDRSICYYQRALTIVREMGDQRSEGLYQDNLGRVYGDMGEIDKAIEHTKAALRIFEGIENRMANQARRQLEELQRGGEGGGEGEG